MAEWLVGVEILLMGFSLRQKVCSSRSALAIDMYAD